jgi:predicted ester cyclase
VTRDFVRHDSNAPDATGPEGERQVATMYLTAFPDLRFTVERLIADDEYVAARLTVRGTHQGDLMGIPPTGRPIAIQLKEHYRLVDGRMADQWATNDVLGMPQQLGALPTNETRGCKSGLPELEVTWANPQHAAREGRLPPARHAGLEEDAAFPAQPFDVSDTADLDDSR